MPEWARWRAGDPFTVGAEEEVMLLDAQGNLVNAADAIASRLPKVLRGYVATETHGAALEIASSAHATVGAVASQLRALRYALNRVVSRRGLRLASSGTHPCAVWQATAIARGARQRAVYSSMRELARREPTFALHVHVAVPDPDLAVRVANRMRAHLPLLLALSGNSPFWQGRDAGFASARTPLFQAFPRVGIPRVFESYADWIYTVEVLIRAGAFPEPTFLWWDVRLQPRLGTVEIRIPDAQTTVDDSAALCALVQCIARLEAFERYASESLVNSPEVLAENRFLAARDGMGASLIAPDTRTQLPARALLAHLVEACAPHASALDCADELAFVAQLSERTGADRQRELAGGAAGLGQVVDGLAAAFCSSCEPVARVPQPA